MFSQSSQWVSSMRGWLAYRGLVGLACRENFNKINPDYVARTIQRFSHSQFYKSPISNTFDYARDPRPLTCKHALMRIWELSEGQANLQTQLCFKWHRVMAMCNILYSNFDDNARQEAARS